MKKILLFALMFSSYSLANDLSFSVETKEPESFFNLPKLKTFEQIEKQQKQIAQNTSSKAETKITEAKIVSKETVKVTKETKSVTLNTVPTINDIVNKNGYHHQIVGKASKGETCWDAAARYHQVDPWLLYSIAYVESGFNPMAVGKNKNGTRDLGMMQINDKVWLPKLAKVGITKPMLNDACLSIYVGAWILKQNINEFGYTAKAIGAYNSRTPVHNRRYARKVYDAYAKLTKLHKMQERNK